MTSRYLSFILTLFFLTLIVYILFIGKALLLPMVIALVFWYIIIRLSAFYKKISWLHVHLPNKISLLFASITTALILYLFFWLFTYSIVNITHEATAYQLKLQEVLDWINHVTNQHINSKQIFAKISISQLFSKLAFIASTLASNIILIIVYLLFLLFEYHSFDSKLKV